MGVVMEHSICMFVPSTSTLFDRGDLRAVVDAAGVEMTFLGSDLGRTGDPTPVEGMAQIVDLLAERGYGDGGIVRITSENAAPRIRKSLGDTANSIGAAPRPRAPSA